MKTALHLLLALLLSVSALGQQKEGKPSKARGWRTATEKELQALLPARAQVEKERIETEMRTASGITDGSGRYVAGILLITAGYSAEGKYSHYLVVQSAITVGNVNLTPGEYVFGYHRNGEVLTVSFYDASSGKPIGTAEAKLEGRKGRISSFRISPPAERGIIELGRFSVAYKMMD